MKITQRGLNLLVLGLFQWIIPTLAIYENQAGVFDWHHIWLGHPREAYKMDDQHMAIYSERNVVASLDINTGAVVWRQVLENQIQQFVGSDAGILTISSQPEHAQFWNKTDGRLIWEHALVEETFGSANAITTKEGDVIVFIGTTKLVKLDAHGHLLWTWTRKANEDQVFEKLKLVHMDHLVYVIAEPDEDAGSPYFTVYAVDIMTGEPQSNFKVPCSHGYAEVSFIGHHLFWQEQDILKWTPIHKKDVKTISIKSLVKSLPSAESFTPGDVSLIGEIGTYTFILSATDEEEEGPNTVSVLVHIENDTLVLGKDFGEEATLGTVDFNQGKLTRVIRTSPEEFAVYSHPDQKELEIKHDFRLSGAINYVKLMSQEPLRLFVVTESSSVFCYNDTSLVWSREESLSQIAASEFVDLPEQKMWTQMADELDETASQQAAVDPLSRYLLRLRTHLAELRHLPNWARTHMTLAHTPKDQTRLTQSCWVNQSVSDVLYRDNFGMRKILVSVTKSGKIVAQDTARQGLILWSRYIRDVSFDQIVVVRAASVKLPPLVVAIGKTYSEMDGETTGFIRLNALTGEDYVTQVPDIADYFEAIVSTNIGVDKVMRVPTEDPDERTQLLAVYEAGTGRIYIYPDTIGARQKFIQDVLPTFYFTHQNQQGQLSGYRVVEGYRGSLRAEPLWKLNLPPQEVIVKRSQRANEKIASLGRALGNRNVLFKYLNPNMFALITKHTENKSMKVRIMDAVKGSILYETVHDHVDLEANTVQLVQSENWFVYHFWSNDQQARGYQAVVLELFEGEHENERVKSTNFSSFDNIRPHVLSSAFAFPYPVNAMGVTSTRNGISTKDILFGLPTHQIVGFNKRLFDPRRPHNKPTKEEQEEQLLPYAPIPDEKRLFLTYDLDVVGIHTIIASPSLLESTSLVYAYGLDTFFTRSSPSRQFDVLSEDFSKFQLLLTITGLVVGILITGPMVRRKRVNALWK
ncbi:ER membrane protein complex subunit 1 [Choanephora cucurbitarum]|uniref:ER membrane protein complex subunit 1 n=1 Tax=Choanephora cucurbitarum TaxID=101091 RepID=A0A1C7NCF4_9FUNG|nr:ER membrane protein complex subunit 1 [Choanephora cucurbitarum]